MSVEVQLIGRFGNNLFQYAIGRILSEELGYELRCIDANPNIIKRDRGINGTLIHLERYFPNISLNINGHSFEVPEEKYSLDTNKSWSGQQLPLNDLLSNRSNRRIILKGFFQRTEYFIPYKERIRHWFTLPDLPLPFLPQENDIVIHIRRGIDYSSLGWVLDLNYYLDLIQQLAPSKVYVCGVGIDKQIKEKLHPYSPIYCSGTPIEDFYFISKFNRIILSNSTFAWWAAWLSEAEEIYLPRPESYWSKGFPEVALEVPETRYIHIDNVRIEAWQPFKRIKNVQISLLESNNSSKIIVSLVHDNHINRFELPKDCKAIIEAINNSQERFGLSELKKIIAQNNIQTELQHILKALIVGGAIELEKRAKEDVSYVSMIRKSE